MVTSELHNRLEHLVSYSSQLIFVSGDTIGEQQRSLQSFLSQQNENTEIAYFNAEPDRYEQSYRRQISQQLLGDDEGLFNRPLNEVLAPLNHHEGPVIICICQAEHLPQGFLQELWNLVLQSRFASNKQHLNVILFGKASWAEKAKRWLPDKNRDRPLLLSTESIQSSELPDSQLDQMIAQKRAQFAKRMQARQQSYVELDSDSNLLSKLWFKLIIGFAFLATFSGLVLWQYGQGVSDMFGAAEPVQIAKQQDDNVNRNATTPKVVVVETPSIPATESNEIAQVDTQKTVLDWQPEKQLAPIAAPEPQQSNAEVNDYPVEDIVSVEQLPTSEPTKQVVQESTANKSEQKNAENQVEITQPTWLNNLQDGDYLIQIAGLSDVDVLSAYLRDNQLSDRVWQYKTTRFGGDWFVLLVNQRFASQIEAQQQIAQLPIEMKTGTPFVKSAESIKAELQLLRE